MYLYLMSLEEKYGMEKYYLKIDSKSVIVILITPKIQMSFFLKIIFFMMKRAMPVLEIIQ